MKEEVKRKERFKKNLQEEKAEFIRNRNCKYYAFENNSKMKIGNSLKARQTMKLVDVNAVLLIIEKIKLNKNIPKNYGTLLDISRKIRKLPTVDATSVVHAHWEECNNELNKRCSNCGKVIGDIYSKPKYCEYCGANMDGEVTE